MIVEKEQDGKAKAECGRKLIPELSDYQNIEFQKWQMISAEFNPFKLGWSHYQILMRMKNENARKL